MKAIEGDKPIVYQMDQELVLSLPYADDVDQNYELQAKEMIAAEMKTMEKKDYLKNYPVPTFNLLDSDKIQKEIQRVLTADASNEVKPSGDEWKSRIERLKTSIQYYRMRRTCQALLRQHGCNVWEKNIKLIKDATELMKMRNKQIVSKITEINSERQSMQLAYKEKEDELKKRYNSQVEKNIAIQMELAKQNVQKDAI